MYKTILQLTSWFVKNSTVACLNLWGTSLPVHHWLVLVGIFAIHNWWHHFHEVAIGLSTALPLSCQSCHTWSYLHPRCNSSTSCPILIVHENSWHIGVSRIQLLTGNVLWTTFSVYLSNHVGIQCPVLILGTAIIHVKHEPTLVPEAATSHVFDKMCWHFQHCSLM